MKSSTVCRVTPHGSSSQRYDRFASLTAFLAPALLLVAIGCGSNNDAPENTQVATKASVDSAEQVAVEESRPPEPTEIVSQFLDRMRRGGESDSANELLTKLARQEMVRIGRPLQLLGSPDTRFEVRQAYSVPNDPTRMWVATLLTEPMEDGQSFSYEVVWTLRQESDGWRISGFATDQGDDEDPLEIDFEDGDRLASILGTGEIR
ncbi:MAG: hypothetical protein AAFU85_04490 [Planctomycetota bacterium]